jgi:hypothetical protein
MMEVIMSTVAGLVPNDERANSVIASLGATGIAENQVVVLRQPADVWQRLDGHHKLRAVFRSALIGLLIGIVIGLCYGIPTGILNCRFMNCSIGNSLILLSLVTLYWAAGGAFLGAIVGLDRLERSLYSYVEGVRRGEDLVVIESPESQTIDVIGILTREGGSVVSAMEVR